MEEAPRECPAQSGIAREWETVKNSRREWQIPTKEDTAPQCFQAQFRKLPRRMEKRLPRYGFDNVT